MLLSCATITMSDSFTAIKASGRNDLDSLMHSKHEHNKKKFSRVFNQQLAVLLGILRFSASNVWYPVYM